MSWPQNGRDARVELTYLAWNRKVQHILATGRLDGVVVVYDLKKQRPIIELKDKAGCAAPLLCPAAAWTLRGVLATRRRSDPSAKPESVPASAPVIPIPSQH